MKSQPIVVIETNRGTIEIALKPDVAPKACENFLTLAKNHYYKNCIFHRVIPGFMIQGGDPTGTGMRGSSCWNKPFADECNAEIAFTKPGLLAMANAGPNTNGSQFFITTAKTPWLNMRHTIFGEVIKGYETVQAIEEAKTDPQDRPKEEQKILKVYIKEQEANLQK